MILALIFSYTGKQKGQNRHNMFLTIRIYSIPIDNVINAAFQFVKSFQNNWLIAQVLTDQFPGDSDAFGNSQFTWPMIVRLKKQALAAASFPPSDQLSWVKLRAPSLRAACAPVAIVIWIQLVTNILEA